ncbi:MAG TPA: GLUG motif-containing protein [Gallionella sp.]|nr:GLUG motif-containing protein [Gallionella sp.]
MNRKSANRQLRKPSQFRLKPVYAAVLLAFAAQTAQANPTGATVMSGSAGFATSGNTLTVTNTPGTIINWQGFSIGSNEVTRFAQQSASSAVLNRVVGSDPSNIMGTLQSNGRVFLINPHGIVFGAGSVVDVAGLVASTLGLSDADFLAGNNHFTEVPGAANISNAGNISAQDQGQIYLIAPNVENTGVITAPNGEILLAAGYSVDLVSTNDPNLRVSITAPAGDATNVGQLIASSGSLGLFGTVVGNSGIVSADSATMQGGKIVFKASQRAEISGTVSANGTTGGSIEALGGQVGVMDGAMVSADGTHGGGTVLIGGDAHGANPDVPNAQVTYVAPAAAISANATQSGDGGKVVVWSDEATQFDGNISSRGGADFGNGGWVEVSGKQWLGFDGLVNTTAANGMVGSLLLDPTDITISANTSTGTMIWNATGSYFADIVNSPSNLDVAVLTGQLKTSNVTVDSNLGSAGGVGNITVQNAIAWSSPYSLTLNAAGTINVNADITNADTSTTGGLSLLTTGGDINIGGNIKLAGGAFSVDTSGSGTISMTGAVDVGSFVLSSGTWKQISATLPGFVANTGFNVLSGTFIRALGGDGSTANPYQLADIYGVQGIGSAGMFNFGKSYVLANNIDATVTKNWLDVNGAPVGFAPIGNAGQPFWGTFDGQNHTISNLVINRPTESYVGLFGQSNGIDSPSSISNVGLVNPIVTGNTNVGALVGYNTGIISNSYANGGTVTGTSYVGGLVGYNYATSAGAISVGSISNSYRSGGTVSGNSSVGGLAGFNSIGSNISKSHVDGASVISAATDTSANAGGLVGNNSGTISNSYVSNGSVSSSAGTSSNYAYNFGGLVGYNTGSISTSYVSGGSVSSVGDGSYNIGGLVGYNNSGGMIDSDYASNVTVSGNHTEVGGLVGNNSGSVSNSYASGGTVSGSSNGVGGLVGYNYGTIDTSFASNSSVSGSSYDVGGLVGYNIGSISNTYASGGTVSGSDDVGGLVGFNLNSGISISTSYASVSIVSGGANVGGLVGYAYGGSVSASFWNTTVESGISSGIGFDASAGKPGTDAGGVVFGMSDADMKTMANFTSATTANGNLNPLWDFTSGTVWHMTDGLSMPLLPFSPLPVAAAPNVIDEIVTITNQDRKKPGEDVLAVETLPTDANGNPLPMCN